MSSMIGERIRLSIFGESHGEAIGCVLDGLPTGETLDMDDILLQMARRAPGTDPTSTTRKEGDVPQLVSGFLNGRTTGAPLTMLIQNTNPHSGDYNELERKPRPGHADYTGHVRYDGFNDVRGGGHFSGRLTAPLVFAGAVCRQILRRRGITIGGHIYRIADVSDIPFDMVSINASALNMLSARPFSLLDQNVEPSMRAAVEQARLAADSVGGVIEAAAVGLPAGLGSPMFDGIENRLSALLFGIPAVKGVEFGDGFMLSGLRGSQANDTFYYTPEGAVATHTNHNGGILGGITTGMPVVVRVAIKPTPSIGQLQDTIDLESGQNTTLTIHGRHDPCIVPRALPVVEAALAVGILDAMEVHGYGTIGNSGRN